jgi:hypothetical protein
MSEKQPVQPISLPLIVRCPAASPSTDLFGGGGEPTIQVQLDTLGGQIYLVPLSVLAARNLLLALSNWRPAVEAVQKTTAPEEPKPQ